MASLELRFAPCGLAEAQALADAFDNLLAFDAPPAVATVETAPGAWQVTAYLGDFDGDLETDILAPLSGMLGALPAHETADSGEHDWVAEGLKDLKPVRAGRFLVHGSHDRGAVRSGDIAIEVEAGQAFGTGHHGTTRGCLMVLDDLVRRGIRPGRVLDLGTGSGVLAIAAAKAFRVPVVASDIDPVAIDVARDNVRLNGAGPFVRLCVAAGTRHAVIRSDDGYDLIFANILARPLIRLAPDIFECAIPGALVVLSGLLDRQMPPVRAAFAGAGFTFQSRIRLEGWSTLLLRA